APAAEPPPQPDPAPDGNRSRVIQLVVSLVLITAVFIALGWGYLLLFIAILFAIVMLHEFGHFITAKRAGMQVTEYFVGFGPRLWSVRKGETEYGVKAIPAGGYVRIIGFTSTEEVPEEDEARAYRNQPFHQRIIVASAGSIMHLIIAFVLALILVLSFGHLTNNYTVQSLEQWPGTQTPAALAGLKAGDTIVSINGKTFSNPNTMENVIKSSTGKQLELGVERNGQLIHLSATPKNGKDIKVGGQSLDNRGYLGVEIKQATAPVGLLASVGNSFNTMWQVTDQEVVGLGNTFSPSGVDSVFHQVTNSKDAQSVANNPGSQPRPVSIIGIANLGAQTEQAGLQSVLLLLITINIVFAILNMLPMIPLDGGHVAIAAYEWIRTKKGGPYYRADITKLFPFAAAILGVLVVLVLAGIYLDITHPLQLPH
ncbi:MAG TPA: M50 family metallopeptidase, partial [Acidimicrobiales bacterium]